MTRINYVPNRQPRDFIQRLLEIIVGLLPFIFLGLIIVLSRWAVETAAIILLIYTLLWLVRLIGYIRRLVTSFYYLHLSMQLNWQVKLKDIKSQPNLVDASGFSRKKAEKWYQKLHSSAVTKNLRLNPDNIYNAVIIAVYNEPKSVIELTLKAVAASSYDDKKIMLIIAYEERGGAKTEKIVKELAKQYQSSFGFIKALKHPDGLPGEVKAKAGNITYAAKYLSRYCQKNKLDASSVIVTTLDADNQLHPQYLAGLSWTYAMAGDRLHRSYQPIPLFNNNIWDAPALVRVIATDTSFWLMMETTRTRRLRPFSSHAQSLKTLQDSNYWNTETIVEDGHQLWRTYFTYNGDHVVLPIWLPIYQDAVLSTSWWNTIRAQRKQLRRWAWSVSDTPFVIRQAYRTKTISWPRKLMQIWRQLDDFMAWSTAPIVLLVGGWLPLLLSPHPERSIIALNLPYVLGALQLIAVIGIVIPIAASLMSLPPRPRRYTRTKNLSMLLQWVLEPVALVGFVAMVSLGAHLRLVFNKPLEKFDVTDKVRK